LGKRNSHEVRDIWAKLNYGSSHQFCTVKLLFQCSSHFMYSSKRRSKSF
jgi:hypothetical protein